MAYPAEGRVPNNSPPVSLLLSYSSPFLWTRFCFPTFHGCDVNLRLHWCLRLNHDHSLRNRRSRWDNDLSFPSIAFELEFIWNRSRTSTLYINDARISTPWIVVTNYSFAPLLSPWRIKQTSPLSTSFDYPSISYVVFFARFIHSFRLTHPEILFLFFPLPSW